MTRWDDALDPFSETRWNHASEHLRFEMFSDVPVRRTPRNPVSRDRQCADRADDEEQNMTETSEAASGLRVPARQRSSSNRAA